MNNEPKDRKLENISVEDLKGILEAHAIWVLSDREEGQRADLRDADLRHFDLRGTNMDGADLQGADLSGAELFHTNFWAANLQDVNLSSVRGLTGEQLAGANLCGAILPSPITRFDALPHLEATAGIARPIFILILLICIYAIATVASTTDSSLLTNSSSALLPDLDTPIPTAGFYIAAPIILFSLHIYLHYYVQELWEDITSLPAIFPDGIPLYKLVYPWLLIRLMAHHVVHQETGISEFQSIMRRFIGGLFVFLVWWLVPLTLLLFWGRYLPAREWTGTGLHIILIVIAVGFGGLTLRSYGLARAMPNNPESKPYHWNNALKDARTYQTGTAIIVGLVLLGLSTGSTYGCRSNEMTKSNLCTWVPSGFALIGYSPFADFRNSDVSTKPENWSGTESDILLVQGANLVKRNLRYANATEAFLAKANLHQAKLGHSNLTSANLEQANLSDANLEKADVSIDANLRKANLASANLRKTDFTGSILREAELNGADLEKARLRFADLQGAFLTEAKLRKADLTSANLTGAFLSNADAQKAQFNNAILRKAYLGHTDLRGAIFISVDFTDATLTGADFEGAYLGGSKFRRANLTGVNFYRASFGRLPGFHFGGYADLSDVDLSTAKGLTQQQLDDACGNDKTKLPKGLTITLCPSK